MITNINLVNFSYDLLSNSYKCGELKKKTKWILSIGNYRVR